MNRSEFIRISAGSIAALAIGVEFAKEAVLVGNVDDWCKEDFVDQPPIEPYNFLRGEKKLYVVKEKYELIKSFKPQSSFKDNKLFFYGAEVVEVTKWDNVC